VLVREGQRKREERMLMSSLAMQYPTLASPTSPTTTNIMSPTETPLISPTTPSFTAITVKPDETAISTDTHTEGPLVVNGSQGTPLPSVEKKVERG
jgi:hypothetical protein